MRTAKYHQYVSFVRLMIIIDNEVKILRKGSVYPSDIYY